MQLGWVAMDNLLTDIARSPAVYVQKLELERDSVFLVQLTAAQYRGASFLDDRILSSGIGGVWAPCSEVAGAVRAAPASRPLHFIFHGGHVGSTLLSRLLDHRQGVLNLREPLPLRTLADAHDRLNTPGSMTGVQFDAYLETFLLLWARGFEETRTVVLKATSTAGRIAPRLMAASPPSKAVYLNLRAEPYLATLLAGANAMIDLRGFGPERLARLTRYLGQSPGRLDSLSPGELSAATWLAERLAQARALQAVGGRMIALDFDAMLADLEGTLTQVFAHFDVAVPAQTISAIARSPLLSRYSKAPEQYAYSPAMRAELLAQARREHAAEIRKGLRFLEQLGARQASVAEVL